MPELPEVETLRLQLLKDLPLPLKIEGIEFSDKNLRSPSPRKQIKFFLNQVITDVERRGKYLIFRFENGDGILTHLGMTGQWRIQSAEDEKKLHDHVFIKLRAEALSRTMVLIYNDPRRFGYFELLHSNKTHKLIKNLGSEPLNSSWNWEELYEKVHTRKSPIKNLLMNAALIVGVGNIYASEALFRAGISPLKRGNRLKKKEVEILKTAIVDVLREALEFGGSSIDDYRHLSGAKGQMQNRFYVYDRANRPCLKCQNLIKKITQSGRSTYFCHKCQN